jgi:hypothetical protein
LASLRLNFRAIVGGIQTTIERGAVIKCGVRSNGNEALRLLETNPLSAETKTEIKSLTHWIQQELQAEYTRMLPERIQRTLTVFEKTLYSLTIEEAWEDTGIGRLETTGFPIRVVETTRDPRL